MTRRGKFPASPSSSSAAARPGTPVTSTPITFFVPGKPAPQGSKRHVGRGIMLESSREVGPWRERVALVAHNVMAGSDLLDGAIRCPAGFCAAQAEIGAENEDSCSGEAPRRR